MRTDPTKTAQTQSSCALPAVLGDPTFVELRTGAHVRVVPLNNAATTPPLVAAVEAVNRFLGLYGALHRGAGPRARLTCEAVEGAIESIRRFLGASDEHALIFTSNTSAAVNLMARMMPLTAEDVVVISEIEHTSNNLPWRYNTPARVLEFRASTSGVLDYGDLERIIEDTPRVRVIAVTGASNQTGYVADIAKLARLAKRAGALLFVDAAQLAPHRPLDMTRWGVDALAFSAHKVYAPFGLGVLALPRHLLDLAPVDPGGGSIDMISDRGVVWAPPEGRHQSGTWNATGIVALGASCQTLLDTGFAAIEVHERELVKHAARRLAAIDGLRLHVSVDRYLAEDRIGTFSFTVPGLHYALTAAILEHEDAIEVRAGTICNHRLVRRWFNIDTREQAEIEARMATGDRLASYGIVRASIGLHNRRQDIDQLACALTRLMTSGPLLRYRPRPEHETYEPAD
jgi:selenocysteine lyase/cysteine desulfurase